MKYGENGEVWHRVARKGLTEMSFELNTKRKRTVSFWLTWEKSVPGSTRNHKAPGRGVVWCSQ